MGFSGVSRTGFSGGSELPRRRQAAWAALVVRVLELDRWDESALASVVEPVHVFGDGDLEVVDALPRLLRTSPALSSVLNASAR
jgi:hypothetical protein